MKAVWVVSLCAIASLGLANPSSKEVTFKAQDGLVLQGTLVVPNTGGKFPAVVMLPGSGPTDRNGNQSVFRTDLLKQIAEELAKSGVASLRFDKRSVGPTYMSQYPKDLAKLNEFLSWENHLSDALKAINFVRSQSAIDPKRIGFLGHSEGAMYAMQIAQGEKAPAATLLLSAPGRTLAAVARDQIQASLERNPLSGVDGPKLLADYDATIKGLIETGEVKNSNPLLAPLFPTYASKYIRSLFTFDPLLEAAKMRGPVMVIQAQEDIQISAKKDATPLHQALVGRKSSLVGFLLVPKASHNLKRVGDPNTDPGFEGPVDPTAMRGIVDWFQWVLRPLPGRR